MTKFLAFDLEIAAIIPDGETDWKQYRPLGITCYAMACVADNGAMIADAACGKTNRTRHAPRMHRDECIGLVYNLMDHVKDGYVLLSHNGVSFDFDILAEESGMHAECVELAMNSVDTCLQMHCIRGFPVGLDAICRAMGVKGKLEGMSGALAPQMWAEGKYDEVLAYVAQDARCTLEVALEIEKHRYLRWVSKSGVPKMQFVPMLMPVREVLQMPLPNTSWMKEPIPRERFTQWMQK